MFKLAAAALDDKVSTSSCCKCRQGSCKKCRCAGQCSQNCLSPQCVANIHARIQQQSFRVPQISCEFPCRFTASNIPVLAKLFIVFKDAIAQALRPVIQDHNMTSSDTLPNLFTTTSEEVKQWLQIPTKYREIAQAYSGACELIFTRVASCRDVFDRWATPQHLTSNVYQLLEHTYHTTETSFVVFPAQSLELKQELSTDVIQPHLQVPVRTSATLLSTELLPPDILIWVSLTPGNAGWARRPGDAYLVDARLLQNSIALNELITSGFNDVFLSIKAVLRNKKGKPSASPDVGNAIKTQRVQRPKTLIQEKHGESTLRDLLHSLIVMPSLVDS